MKNGHSSRNIGLDWVKTLAIFAVIGYHSFTASIDVGAGGVSARVHYGVYSALCLGVPLFFLVNGYLLFSKPLDVRRHTVRTLRLVVLTVWWQLVTLLVLMPVKGETMGAGEILRAVLYGKAGWTDHFWFLGALSMAYVFFPAAKAAFDHARSSFVFFLLATLLLTFGNALINMAGNTAAVLVRGAGFETENFFSIFNAYAGVYGFALGYFLLGGALFAARERLTRIPMGVYAGVLALCITGQSGYGLMQSAWRGVTWDSVFRGYDTIFALVGSLCVFGLSQRLRFGRTGAWWTCLGAMTLPMYLWQGVLIPWLRPMAKGWTGSDSLVFAFGFALLLFAVCAAASWVCRRIPGLRSLFRF